MSIKVENLQGVAPLDNIKRTLPTESPAKSAKAEPLVNISKTAADREDFMRALDIVRDAESPTLRADRIAELKAKINDPAYINESIIKLTADRVADLLLG
jgi:negative regulator of flagellin synthesis FlgM